MTFYHCWVHIPGYQKNYNRNSLFNLREKLNLSIGFELKTIFNGTEFLTVTGNMNHYSHQVRNCLQFFKELPNYLDDESYGILYLWDDEDLNKYNTFQVWSLKNCVVEEKKDNILSPIELE